MNTTSKRKWFHNSSGKFWIELALFGAFALWMLGTALVGTLKQYSQMPYWDVWDSALGFYLKFSEGDWSSLWAQHNEHRIVIGKLLFWLDLKIFGGVGVSLLSWTYLAIIGMAALFCRLLKKINNDSTVLYGQTALSLFVVAWLFQFSNNENLINWFQTCLILSQLLPLAAFYLFHLFLDSPLSIKYYSGAVILAILAGINLASGLAVLPLLFVAFVLFWRQINLGYMRKCVLAAGLLLAAIAFINLYFNGWIYTSNSSLLSTLARQDGFIYHYLLYYFGTLFFYVGVGFGCAHQSAQSIALVSGLIFVTGSVILMAGFAIQVVRGRSLLLSSQSTELVLFLFLVFAWMSALASGGVRYNELEGLNMAFTSRYVFFVICAWSCVLVWLSPLILGLFARHFILTMVALALFAIIFIPYQQIALNGRSKFLFYRDVAGLALELGIKDGLIIKSVYPRPENIYPVAESVVERNLSAFGRYPWKDLRQQFDQSRNMTSDVKCGFEVEQYTVIDEEKSYLRVQGWMVDSVSRTVPERIWFMDRNHHAIGVALTGEQRKDLAELLGGYAEAAGFLGYIKADVNQLEYAIGESHGTPVCMVNK
jgi:hypothetical protein